MIELVKALAWIAILLIGVVMVLGLGIIITAEIGVIQRLKADQRQPQTRIGPFVPYEISRRR